MVEQSHKTDSIFWSALAIAAPGERDRYLDEACADDPNLRVQLDELLAAYPKVERFLEKPAIANSPPWYSGEGLGEGTIDSLPISERPGTVIGPYKLLQQIGEGGMGVVFMAEQTEPIQRTVALKIIKPGMDTQQVIARFEAERQALAMMDHPNIARVLDAGTTGAQRRGGEGEIGRGGAPDFQTSPRVSPSPPLPLSPSTSSGRPYFVMDLVKGVPITEYCDQQHLSVRQRLELFTQVCHAVQHAHQKGIIHRDLKPSNVLVAEYDGKPVPKVIDFGVAKATAQRLTERTMFTQYGQIVGTFEYMSPEQARFNQLDVDTRSDIYSLGVLLYELLAGSTPLDKERLRSAAFDEILRIISEEDPPRPSTRLSSSQSLPSIAANRNLEPKKLTGLISGELDWIVMKCLEKDRNRRYETANGLGQDIERYLQDEPVQACPPSVAYRFRRFARRNKATLATALALALAVLLTIVGLVANNRLVTREKQRADENLARARQAVKEYLLKTSQSPLLQGGDFQNLRKELLETAIPFYLEFIRQKQEDPELEAERGRAYEDLAFLRQETGDLERASGELKKAQIIFRGLSEQFPANPAYRLRLGEILNSRGNVFLKLSRFAPAELSFREALGSLDQLVAEHPTEAEYRESLARTSSNLGVLLKDSSRHDEAEKMLRQSITIREKLIVERPAVLELREQIAQSWVNLGAMLFLQRRSDDAEQAFLKALEVLDPGALEKLAAGSTLLPNCQQLRAQSFNNLGNVYCDSGRLAEAEKAHRQALAIKEKLAETFPSVPQFRLELARSFSNLGVVLSLLEPPAAAQTAFEKSISIYERLAADFRDVPAYSVELAATSINLGRVLGDNGQLEPSLATLTKCIDILDATFRRDRRVSKVRESLFLAHCNRAKTLVELRRFPEALTDWDRAIELDDGHYHNDLRLRRASNLIHMKDHARATADAQAVAESSKATSEDLYLAACAYAGSARLARDNLSLAESYAARAVLLLRQAVVKGLENAARMKSDPELNALRSREDFQKLMNDVEAEQLE